MEVVEAMARTTVYAGVTGAAGVAAKPCETSPAFDLNDYQQTQRKRS